MKRRTDLLIDGLIQEDSFDSFLKSVRNFCAFIKNDKTENDVTFLRLAQAHLQTLYLGGQKLQPIDLNYNLDFEDIMTNQELEKVLNNFASRLKTRYYWHVFAPVNEEDIEPVCGDLLDDLGDIYKDLKNALLCSTKGRRPKLKVRFGSSNGALTTIGAIIV